jgi:hypothetical protein
MITQEQYDSLNVGDTLTACYESLGGDEDFEAKGKVYGLSGMKFLAGKNLIPGAGAHRWTIIEHIPATPAWRSAQVISATRKGDDKRRVFLPHPSLPGWWVDRQFLAFRTEDLTTVKILVDKDAEL